MEPMDLLADTRRYLDAAIRQLAAIEAGVPITEPLKREEAISLPSRSAFSRVCYVGMEVGTPPGPKGKREATPEVRVDEAACRRR